MATKLDTFLQDKKIDQRRLLAASRDIERLRAEDRATRLSLKQARKSEDAKRPEGIQKPRSGKPVNVVTLTRVLRGDSVSGATKTRVLRAVNRILQQRKQAEVGLSDLFE